MYLESKGPIKTPSVKASKQTPLKRLGKPDEVASAILFLANEESSYVTGTNLIVDGGWSAI